MSKKSRFVPKPVTVTIGDKDYTLGRIPGRRGLKAASIILPHLDGIRASLEAAMSQGTAEKDYGRIGVTVVFDALKTMAPLLEPDTFLELAEAVTGIDKATLEEAPFEDLLTATVTGFSQLNILKIIQAAIGLFGQMTPLRVPAKVPEEPSA